MKEEDFLQWAGMASDTASICVFRFAQFIDKTEDLKYGGVIQKVVCKKNNIPEMFQKNFWNRYGRQQVYAAIKQKRQTVTYCMKNKFKGKDN